MVGEAGISVRGAWDSGVAVSGLWNAAVLVGAGAGAGGAEGLRKMRTTPIWMKSRMAARAGGTSIKAETNTRTAMSAHAHRPDNRREAEGGFVAR